MENTKKKRLSEHRAVGRHLVKTQIMTAKEVVASDAVSTKQAEQFDVLLALYVQKNNLSMPNLSTAMPPLKTVLPLEMNPDLLSDEKDDIPPKRVDQ
ncbi:hypothetical protein BWQ96_07279 [Gracilariopsis chorda]|uniref:Uncharacterized protein n=1 Tax=Gracilariopsis chorda TaxID=448386 RepID=A0A2V3ILL3_9FLOR|nr:hypothetical protein BWQ96_07279 [Gracilariopsis chorda]|eukprot:PXF42975.1 hypothetical protein BWQ96_07279 [Gracilariopsis chorda]